MKIDFAETIREVLDDRNPVTIIGLGTIALKQNASQFGALRKTLQPPKISLDFTENVTENLALYDWLSKKYDLNEDQAKKAHAQFCQSLLNRLVNYGEVNIPGVVSFKKSDSQSIFNYEGDEAFLNLFYKGFPAIPVEIYEVYSNQTLINTSTEESPLSEIETGTIKEELSSTNESKGVNENIKEHDLDKTSVNNPGVDVLAETSNSDNTEEASTLTINERWAQNNASPSDGSKEDLSTEIKYVQKEKTGCGLATLIVLITTLLLLFMLWFLMCEKTMAWTKNADKGQIDTLVSDSINNLSAARDSMDVYALSDSFVTGQRALPEYCIIVTGVFKKARYVLRMQDVLSRDGYEVYKEVNGDFTRVGIKFDCSDVNLEDYLQNIRRTYSPKAWYLDPELYVEYEK